MAFQTQLIGGNIFQGNNIQCIVSDFISYVINFFTFNFCRCLETVAVFVNTDPQRDEMKRESFVNE